MDPERLSASDLLPGVPFRIYHTTLKETYPLHWHDFYELAIVRRGEGTHIVNGRKHTLSSRTLFLLTPVDFHTLAPAPGQKVDLYNIIFGGEFLDPELRQWLFTDKDYHHLILPAKVSSSIASEMARTWDESQADGLGRNRLMRSSLEKILLEIARYVQGKDRLDNSGHSAIHNALLYLNHHFRSTLTLADVAEQAGLSPTYFSQVFHKVTGSQFQKYLSDLRLRFAASLLLADASLPVTEICFASGFRDMAHFGRAFHARYNTSPSQYRQVREGRKDK
jgi:AraC-like DNA-binding protein